MSSNQPSPILMVIDAQVDFVDRDGVMPCINAYQVIERIIQLVDFSRQNDIPVLFTREAHSANLLDFGHEMTIQVPQHCIVNTPGYEIVAELTPEAEDFIIDKRRYSAFLGTHLDIILNSFTNPTLFITGFTTNACVHHTVMDAWQRDFPVHVLEDCISATTEEKHRVALKMLDFISPEIRIDSNQFITQH